MVHYLNQPLTGSESFVLDMLLTLKENGQGGILETRFMQFLNEEAQKCVKELVQDNLINITKTPFGAFYSISERGANELQYLSKTAEIRLYAPKINKNDLEILQSRGLLDIYVKPPVLIRPRIKRKGFRGPCFLSYRPNDRMDRETFATFIPNAVKQLKEGLGGLIKPTTPIRFEVYDPKLRINGESPIRLGWVPE